jgi:spore coat polysaccharide biosynthesis protein SpsF
MKVVAVIQARMASTRLPGKVVLPLDGNPLLEHVVRRTDASEMVDETVVATTFNRADDIVAEYAKEAGANVYRGSEDDVLGRIWKAANENAADVIIRVTGDNPFIDPQLISEIAVRVTEGADYVSNKIERTWPLGVDAEGFNFSSFSEIKNHANEPHHREHVTPYYRENPNEFSIINLKVTDVYGEWIYESGPELRLTMDEFADYKLYRQVYEEVEYDTIIDIQKVEEYILSNNLDNQNKGVSQKSHW